MRCFNLGSLPESWREVDRSKRDLAGCDAVLGVKGSEGEGRLKNQTSTTVVRGWCLSVQQDYQPE